MADENQDEEQKRLQLEEFQRQQAAAAVEASRNQPNAITNEPAVRGVDRAVAPNAIINAPQGTPAIGIGDYIDRNGNELGPTHNEQGVPNPPPAGVVGVQGRLSPQEQQFWAANPLGTVMDRSTGALIGLGNDESTRQARLRQADISPTGATGYQPPDQTNQRAPLPNFINIPQVDPALQERRNQIQAALDENADRLRGASTTAGRGRISDYARYSAERNQLIHAHDSLGLEIHRQTQDYNQAVHQNSAMQKDYSTSIDSAAAAAALGKITAPLGSAERTQALANLPNQYPDARRDQRFDSRWLDEVKQNADHAAYMQYAQQNGLVPQMVHTGPTGVSYNYKPASEQEISASKKELDPYHISLNQIRNPAEVQVINDKGEGDPAGKFVQLVGTGTTDKPSRIPLSLYQKYGGQLSPQDQAAQVQPQGAPQPTAQPPAQQQQSTFPPTGTQRTLGGKTYVSDGTRFVPQ